ncbi:hypothetical protein EJ110_NYTH07259 [Nymphaea thermarum]|nr:hypothetical protein EJ110_NYTH07259 [Nymphaea thermarum]
MTTIAATTTATTSNGGPCYVIAMKGHPGSGKSTLAGAIAADLRCPLLDKDDIRDCTAAVQAAIPDTTTAASLCNELSYSVLWQLTETQLRLGLGIVVDCPLSRRRHFDRVSQVATAAGSRLLVVECRPGDAAEWRRRLERRGSEERDRDVFRHKPATWEELQGLVDGYEGCWDYNTNPIPKLVVDTTAPHGTVDAVSVVRRWVNTGNLD